MVDLYPDIEVGDVLTEVAEAEILSFTAAVDVTKGDPVYLSADLTVSPATSAQDCIGVALKSVKAGEQVPVLTRGVVKMVGGGAITRGKAVYGADSSKRVLALPDINEGGTSIHSWTRKLGIALQTFTAAGDTGLIYVCK